MELKTDEIITALECCASKGGCKKCPLQPKESLAICVTQISKNALALIKELAKENERLRDELAKRPPKLVITKLSKKESKNV